MNKIITASFVSFILFACQSDPPLGDMVVRLDDRDHLLSDNDRDDIMADLKEKAKEWNNCGSGRSIWVKNINEPGTVPIVIVPNDSPYLNGGEYLGWTQFHNGSPLVIYLAKDHCKRILAHELGHAFSRTTTHTSTGVMANDPPTCNTDYRVSDVDCHILPRE